MVHALRFAKFLDLWIISHCLGLSRETMVYVDVSLYFDNVNRNRRFTFTCTSSPPGGGYLRR